MVLEKGDFISIEFTGRIKNGDIFDSNIDEDLKKANIEGGSKPFVFCLGEKMFIYATIEKELVERKNMLEKLKN